MPTALELQAQIDALLKQRDEQAKVELAGVIEDMLFKIRTYAITPDMLNFKLEPITIEVIKEVIKEVPMAGDAPKRTRAAAKIKYRNPLNPEGEFATGQGAFLKKWMSEGIEAGKFTKEDCEKAAQDYEKKTDAIAPGTTETVAVVAEPQDEVKTVVEPVADVVEVVAAQDAPAVETQAEVVEPKKQKKSQAYGH